MNQYKKIINAIVCRIYLQYEKMVLIAALLLATACQPPLTSNTSVLDTNSAYTVNTVTSPIEGGVSVSTDAFPAIGYVEVNGVFCSGVLVNHFPGIQSSLKGFFVLTAGHCTVKDEAKSASANNEQDASSYRFILPANRYHKNDIVLNIVEVGYSFSYASKEPYQGDVDYLQEDIAVLVIDPGQNSLLKNIPVDGFYVDQAYLPTKAPLGTLALGVGYGKTSASSFFGSLEAGVMEIVAYPVVANHSNFIQLQSAAGYPTTATCPGDSGSPLYIYTVDSNKTYHRYIWGITSHGNGCSLSVSTPNSYDSIADFRLYP